MSVLVIAERSGGKLHRMSLETMAAGQEAAASLGLPWKTAVVGSAEGLGGTVISLSHPLLASYTADGYTLAFEQLIRHESPRLVVFPHTYQVRDFAPKLATRFGQVLISDVIQIEHGRFVRQLFQGKLNAALTATASAGPMFVSVQAGAYRALDSLPPLTVETFTPEIQPGQIRQQPEAPFRESARAVDLTAAEIIVSVGRGIKDRENLPLIEQLAQAMNAELAASRPICDSGWLPMERQVGSSGQTVAPKVYVAVGISGAIQHLVGMKGAKTIVAINKDPHAPIFEVADYGICGDLFEVVPALIEEVKKARA